MWHWRKRTDEDFSEEIRANIALDVDRFLGEGMTPAEANAAARRAFGNVTRAQERFYRSRRVMWVDDAIRDVSYAVRMLLKKPTYGTVAVVSLALGVGAATAVFSAIEGVVLNPYPYAGADRMVIMSKAEGPQPFIRTYLTPDEARSLAHARSLDAVVLWDEFWMWTKDQGVPESVYAGKLSPNTFAVLGVPPLSGRTFGGDLSTSTTDVGPVAVLSYRYWQAHYTGSADAIGRTIQLDDRQHLIIGIMPERFRFLNADVYVPMSQDSGRRTTLLRVRQGVSRDAAAAELQALVQQVLAPPQDGTGWRNVRLRLTTLRDDEAGSMRGVLGILFGAVVLLLVIGCANVSILLVGRGITRRSELAIRRAIGASQGRILRQLLTESIVVSVAGGMAGVALAYGLLTVILRWIPPRVVPRDMELGIDIRVLMFAAVLAVLAGIAAGISPAFALARSRFSLVGGLGGRGAVSTGGSVRSHRVLTVVQTAAALVLLAGAGAALRTFVTLMVAPLGYAPDHVATFGLALKDRTLITWLERATYYDQLRSAIAAVPGVRSVAVTGPAPLPPVQPRRSRVEIPGVSDGTDQVTFAMVSAAYFSTLRVPVRLGRTWVEAEDRRPAHVGVINDTMARRYWPKGNPIGQRVHLDALRSPAFGANSPGNDQWIEIVGVVDDVRNDGLRKPVLPQIYVPYTLWVADAVLFLVRTVGSEGAIVDAVKRQIAAVNGDQPVMASSTLEERLWENGWARQQFVVALFSSCAALALVLAAIGIYSVVACAVSSRTREFGLRMALGASSACILGGIFKSALATIALGLGSGLTLVAMLHRPVTAWTESSLWNPVSLAPSVLVLAAVGCGAVLIPAWRAATLPPMCVLRSDE